MDDLLPEARMNCRMIAPLLDRPHALDDRLLLEHFRCGGEEAFTHLVRRHGPMVLGVCQRVLRRRHDAEDAFQAVFLILMQKATSLRRDTNLANWLYGVALRTSWAARRAIHVRRHKERAVVGALVSRGEAADAETLSAVLDHELAVLPAIYRIPLLLCLLQGRSRREAARAIGCCTGTLSGRLSRGKRLLARRLARHGFSAICVAGTIESLRADQIPTALLAKTLAARNLLTNPGAVNPAVVTLTYGVLQAMWWMKVKAITALVCLVLLAAGGIGLSWPHPVQAQQDTPATQEPPRTLPKVDPWTDALRKKIDINLRNVTLDQACDALRAVMGVNLVVDRHALEERKLGEGEITLALKDVRAEIVLKIVMTRFDVAYHLKDGIVFVTAKELAREWVTRHYEVGDLMQQTRLSAPALMSIIKATIEPGPRGNGPALPGYGSVQYFPLGQAFVVTQDVQTQERIDHFLRQLRAGYQKEVHHNFPPGDPPPTFEVIGLKHAKAAEVATVLRQIYRDHPNVLAAVDETNNAVILGLPERFRKDILTIVDQVDRPADQKQVGTFRLKRADARVVAKSITELFAGRDAAFQVIPDLRTNAIVVTGSREWISQVGKVVQAVDGDPAKEPNQEAPGKMPENNKPPFRR